MVTRLTRYSSTTCGTGGSVLRGTAAAAWVFTVAPVARGRPRMSTTEMFTKGARPMAGRSARSTKFSPAVLSQIASFVQEGKSPAEIAERIGCKVGSLRVRCSQHGISLRRRNGSLDKTAKHESRVRLTILLLEATADALLRRGRKIGMSRAKFAASLIEHIGRDDLYAPVLDTDSTEPHYPTRRGP